jgi:long-chain acyl-CoA synthetase
VSKSELSTLNDLIRNQSEKAAEQIAIRFGDRNISYGAFYKKVDQFSRMLLGLGIQRGDRLGLMFPNRPEMLELYFACFRIGAIVVPVNTRYQRLEIEYALTHSDCRLLIVDEIFFSKVEGLDRNIPSLEKILVRHSETAHSEHVLHLHMADAPTTVEWPEVQIDDPAVIFYTSGSTSRPKGVTHTHFSLLANARIQVSTREIRPDTNWLVSTGVGYVAGLSGVTTPAFLAGCTLILEPDLQADNLLRAIEKYRAETTLLLPTMLLEMLTSPLSDSTDLTSLKACFVAGDECSHDLYQRFRKRMGHDLLQAFGMTECEGYLSNRPSGANRNLTIGKPADGIRLRLIDEEGNDVPQGKPGEIIVKGDSVMVGYWNDPGNTAQTLVDGWLHGGDIATCDEDGFYTFHERIHEIVIHGGSNVSPHEVEDVIDSHPEVKASCVVGIPDPHYGAVLEAYIVWEPDASRRDLDGLRRWLSEQLAAYKVPDCWHSMDVLPKTATGKIDRKALHLQGEAELR